MIRVFSKSHDVEIFLNENKIIYIVPSIDVGSIIHFDNGTVLAVKNDITYLSSIFFPEKVKPVAPIITPQVIGQPSGPVTLDSELPDFPKLPNGNVDKRSLVYRQFHGTSK